jgi:plasmid stabilization system protein ParE
MARVVWSDAALQQILQIYDFIYKSNPQAAMDVAEDLRARGNSLASFPDRGRPVGRTNLRELVAVYPYVIRYRHRGGNVTILRIRHTSRRPTRPDLHPLDASRRLAHTLPD